jgi:hypothetical protein
LVGRGVHVVGVLLFVVAGGGAAVFRTVGVILVVVLVATARAAAVVRTIGVGGVVSVWQREAAGGHLWSSEGLAFAMVALGRGHKTDVCAALIQAVSGSVASERGDQRLPLARGDEVRRGDGCEL